MTIYIRNYATLLRKISFTLGIIVIYCLGMKIPLALVSFTGQLQLELLSWASYLSAGNVKVARLFSLGLGPWISTMIIWRALLTIKSLYLEKQPKVKTDRMQLAITFVIAVVQAVGLLYLSGGRTYDWYINLIAGLILIAGAYLLIWLGNLNTMYGIGGMTVLILAGMIQNINGQLNGYLRIVTELKIETLLYYVIGFVLLLVLIILFDTLEVQLAVQRVLSTDTFTKESYIALKLNAAGGMAIMYAMTLFALPQYLLRALAAWFNLPELQNIAIQLNLNTTLGISVYCVSLFLLTIGFTFFMVDPEQLTEALRNSGDYFANIMPGRQTYRYLHRILLKLALVSGVMIVLLAGCPLYLVVQRPNLVQVAMLPGILLVFVSMISAIRDQLKTEYLTNKYRSLFK